MAFVGASIYKTGKVETFNFNETGSVFNINKTSETTAEIQTFELNEVDYATYGKVSIKKDGTIVASEFVEI